MNNLEAVRSNRLTAFVCICFCVTSVFIGLMSVINLTREIQLINMVKYMAAALLFLAALISVASRSRLGRRHFGVFLFTAAFLLKTSFALAVDTLPTSDFYVLYNAAENLAHGVNVMTSEKYFLYWPYQSAFVAWMALFIRLFGANIVFFKLTNCLFSALTNLLIYKIARRFASERGARTAGVMFLLYPGSFILVSVLTNQHISEFLMLSAVYVYTSPTNNSKIRVMKSAAAGLLLALSNAMRPVGIIMILAVLVYAIIRVFTWVIVRRGKPRQLVVRATVFIAVYFVFSFSLSAAVKMSGLNDYGLTNNVPEWKFIVGLNEKSEGVYNAEDEQAVFGQSTDRLPGNKELFKERVHISLPHFLKLIYRKSLTMWGSYEPTYWAFTENVYSETRLPGGPAALYNTIERVNKFAGGYYFWANLLAAAGALAVLKKKRIREPYTLLVLIALAYFGAHFFIEVQTRYRSLMTVVTFPLIAPGVDVLLWRCSGLRYLRISHREKCSKKMISG
jgi:4-amino-4-deoxy-L-arabinose transferase-like glycosyltransferase